MINLKWLTCGSECTCTPCAYSITNSIYSMYCNQIHESRFSSTQANAQVSSVFHFHISWHSHIVSNSVVEHRETRWRGCSLHTCNNSKLWCKHKIWIWSNLPAGITIYICNPCFEIHNWLRNCGRSIKLFIACVYIAHTSMQKNCIKIIVIG